MTSQKSPAYKTITRDVYEKHAPAFEKWYRSHFARYVKPEADDFLTHLRGKTIIDLGSGPGTHAEYFQHKGLDVTCVDYSKEMLKRVVEKGIKAFLVDVKDFWMPDKTVDGIWMYSVLSHIHEDEIPGIVANIARMLKTGGVLGLAVREGKKDRYEFFDETLKEKRWFNYFQESEIEEYFSKYFDILHCHRTKYGKDIAYLNCLMRRKK